MKILEPIEKGDIPPAALMGAGIHRALYEQVLALNGLALPVKFDDPKRARHFRALFHHPRGLAKKLGLGASQRGNTVFLYRK